MYLFLILFFSLLFPINSFAQQATTPTLNPKAEEIKKLNKEKVQALQIVSTTTSTPKSVIGTISQIKDNQITVSNNNETKIITITDDTVFTDAKQKKIKLDSLKSGQAILSMGYYDDSKNFKAKKIIITTLDAFKNNNEIIFGTIVDISKTSNILVLIPIKNKNTQYQIKTDSKTNVVDKSGNDLTIDKLKSGQKVVVVIQPDPKISNTFDASRIITFDSSSNSTSPTPIPKK